LYFVFRSLIYHYEFFFFLGFELKALCLQSGPLPLEPHLQYILLWLFWRWSLKTPHWPQLISASRGARITDISHLVTGLEFLFVKDIWYRLKVFFAYEIQLFQYQLLKKTVYWIAFEPLSKIIWVTICWSVSRFFCSNTTLSWLSL
jgi:hypothetical protein